MTKKQGKIPSFRYKKYKMKEINVMRRNYSFIIRPNNRKGNKRALKGHLRCRTEQKLT